MIQYFKLRKGIDRIDLVVDGKKIDALQLEAEDDSDKVKIGKVQKRKFELKLG